jgi:hypothetical protein
MTHRHREPAHRLPQRKFFFCPQFFFILMGGVLSMPQPFCFKKVARRRDIRADIGEPALTGSRPSDTISSGQKKNPA